MAKTKDKPTLKIKTVLSDRLDSSSSKRRVPVVSGYDPKADFGDVLRSWESTGELAPLPKRAQNRPQQQSTKSFEEILSEWEGTKAVEKRADEKPAKKSAPYLPKQDFGALLDAFEGKREKKQPTMSAPRKAPSPAASPLKPTKEISEALAEKDELDEEREVKTAWSFADTYRRWSEQSDEDRAIEKSLKSERARSVGRTIVELRSLEPEATLDLHGLTVLEAEKASADFLREAAHRKLDKVAIITGKGLHNEKGYSLLRDAALAQIRLSGLVREAYTPKERHGGRGVIWIIMKRG